MTSAGQLLSNIRFEDLQKEDDFDKLITGLITCEDYKHALRISNYASQQFKKSPRFVTRKAMCLKSLGRGDDALEVLNSWHQKKDTEIAREKAAILYDLKRFQEYADLIHTMNPDGVSDPVERERYLSALLEGSRFNEALQEIGKSLAKVPNDPGVLQQKFKLQTMLNDISGAYETAERILAVDKANRECSAFVLDYLFGNGEYEKFIERFGSLSKNSGYSKGPLVAALIFSAQVDDAIERIRSDHSSLKQPEVIDALFFTLREEEQVDTVLEICENDGFDLAGIAMSRIKGKKMQFSSTIWDQIKTTRSEAVIWSVAMETINFRDRTRPEMVSALLSDKKFANLSNLSEAIVLVYAGKYYEEMTDNRKFMYPLTEALVENGRTRDAEVKLEQSHDPKRLDPFYHYLLSRIQYLEGDISASRKSILRALGRLSNRNFFLQSIRISISQDDPDSILSALDGIAKMDALESCDLSELFAYVSKDGEENLAKEILHRFGDQDVKNIWINRLQRDQYLRSNEFEEAARISRKIVLNSSKVADDVRKHAILLENTAKEEERVDYLMQEEKKTGDPQIEIWLGDYYYIKKNYEKALETYEKAIQKGTREGEIKNLPETLIELGEFERVEKMLSGSPGNEIALIKLYHRTGRIPEITNLLRNVKVDNKEDEAVIQYISRILWVNRQVRDTLIEMFHSTGSLFLGKIISQHMVESRDFINAERVMRAILKLYPEDAQNIRALSDLLVENNHPSEAAAILLRSVKQFSGAEQREIADRLMRIYFEITEYRALLDFFWKNTCVLYQTIIQWVIRSLI